MSENSPLINSEGLQISTELFSKHEYFELVSQFDAVRFSIPHPSG